MPSPTRAIAAALVLAASLVPISGYAAKPEARRPERIVGLKYKEPKETEFLKAVLRAMNLRYTITATADGELVEWASRDSAQELEIQNRVSQFWFISTQCPGISLPAPSQPARPSLSC